MWEEFTSVVLNRCVVWNWNVINCCRWSATPKLLTINTAPHMHICVSVLWTSVFLWRFDDNKKALLFPTTLLCIRISFSDKLGLKFTVSQQFTSNFFKLQVLHLIFKNDRENSPPYRYWSWWVVLLVDNGLVGSCPSLGIVVLVGNSWAIFLSGGESIPVVICPRTNFYISYFVLSDPFKYQV